MDAMGAGIEGVLLLKPKVFSDSRGFFFEAFNQKVFNEITGATRTFVQDNQSGSHKNVLRGLHYQVLRPQGKLVRVLQGEIFDVVVDLRNASPTFGRHLTVNLSAKGWQMIWVPPGFAHGFLATSDYAEVLYKTTDFYAPELERCIIWNDSTLRIPWSLSGEPILSEKDNRGMSFSEATTL